MLRVIALCVACYIALCVACYIALCVACYIALCVVCYIALCVIFDELHYLYLSLHDVCVCDLYM